MMRENDSHQGNWLHGFPGSQLSARSIFCIAGPCAAESREQVLRTAKAIKAIGIPVLRAGIWKPRTRPGGFEGMGTQALEWLAEAKAETGLLTATEVANEKHVCAALEHGVDLLWIGARSTTNPFAAQEIANALKGVDIPVLVKNPVNPELNLWIGALERLLSAGLTRVGAIHRGISTLSPGELRNDPGWHLAIDLKQRFPQIPVLCDPSHIAGRRDRIQELAQQALDLEFDGLMLETHCNPDTALCDAKQQLTPAALNELLDSLSVRRKNAPESERKINSLRSQIDELDMEILSAVAKRMEIVRSLGELKREQNLTLLQSSRWSQVLQHMTANGSRMGLPEDLILELAGLLHRQAIQEQQNILTKKQ